MESNISHHSNRRSCRTIYGINSTNKGANSRQPMSMNGGGCRERYFGVNIRVMTHEPRSHGKMLQMTTMMWSPIKHVGPKRGLEE